MTLSLKWDPWSPTCIKGMPNLEYHFARVSATTKWSPAVAESTLRISKSHASRPERIFWIERKSQWRTWFGWCSSMHCFSKRSRDTHLVHEHEDSIRASHLQATGTGLFLTELYFQNWRPGEIPFKKRVNVRPKSHSSSLGKIGYPSAEHVCPNIFFPRQMLNYTAKFVKLWSPSAQLIHSLLLAFRLFESRIEEKDEI